MRAPSSSAVLCKSDQTASVQVRVPVLSLLNTKRVIIDVTLGSSTHLWLPERNGRWTGNGGSLRNPDRPHSENRKGP